MNELILSGQLLAIHSPKNNDWHKGVLHADKDCIARLNGKVPKSLSQDIPFIGFVTGQPGERVLMKGLFKKHPQFGDQFDAVASEPDRGVESGGLAIYIANHKELRGIGPRRADSLVKKYGDGLAQACKDYPERIAGEFSISLQTVDRLYQILTEDQVLLETRSWLAGMGLTDNQIKRLIDQYGWRTRTVIESDSYRMIDDIEGFGFFRADQIARKSGLPEDAPCRLRAGVIYEVQQQLENGGHCWIAEKDLVNQANKSLALNSLDSKEQIQQAILDLIAENKLIQVEELIALPWIYKYEMDLQETFQQYASRSNPHFVNIPTVPIELNEDQASAYRAALQHTLCLITGGAGVGKTFLIQSITAAYRHAGKTVLLAAPTGKAARRITESTGCEADTIHRTLKYDGAFWRKNRSDRIDADVIIVDEFSMVDSQLAYRLFEAVDLRRTAVVMVGDHNQLPPVGPGEPLRDLVETHLIPHVYLKKVIRQAGVLKINSSAILNNEIRPTPQRDPGDDFPLPWYLFDEFTDEIALRSFLVDCFEQFLEESFGFDPLHDVQVLTPTRKGPIGTKSLNKHLQKVIQKKLYGVNVFLTDQDPEILPGDKVIQNRNNRDLNVMNGTLGIVTDKEPKGALHVKFEDQIERRLTKGDQKDLSLAYALTIHKSQGSEFPCVISVCHKSHYIMLNKNLIYTAVTRSRKVSILVGDKRGCRYAISKGGAERRRTFLGMKSDK